MPDGLVITSIDGATGTLELAPEALGALNELFLGVPLPLGLRDGFACDEGPPRGVVIRLAANLGGTVYEQDVTHCVLTGPLGNAAREAYRAIVPDAGGAAP